MVHFSYISYIYIISKSDLVYKNKEMHTYIIFIILYSILVHATNSMMYQLDLEMNQQNLLIL